MTGSRDLVNRKNCHGKKRFETKSEFLLGFEFFKKLQRFVWKKVTAHFHFNP